LSQRLHRRAPVLILAAALLSAACAASTVSPSPSDSRSPSIGPTAAASRATDTPQVTTSPPTLGFAFTAEDVVAYYESAGYACVAEQPSVLAAGFFVRTCERVDEAGRTRVVGLVTDPAGDLANGFASVQGTEAEEFLAPIDALEPLAGFLGAMLGEDRGARLLPWLAGHLGDAYAQTMSGEFTIATYSESETDHSALYVEIANEAYIAAPGVDVP